MSLFAFDDAECAHLARAHGTPVFAYRLAAARESWLRLRRALPGRVRLAFAVKANPHPALLAARFRAHGSNGATGPFIQVGCFIPVTYRYMHSRLTQKIRS